MWNKTSKANAIVQPFDNIYIYKAQGRYA
jgi:hypothetical protein